MIHGLSIPISADGWWDGGSLYLQDQSEIDVGE